MTFSMHIVNVFARMNFIELYLQIKIVTKRRECVLNVMRYINNGKMNVFFLKYWEHIIQILYYFLFQLEVKGTGWVSLALTERGSLMGSDVIIGWVAADQSATIIVRNNLTSKRINVIL